MSKKNLLCALCVLCGAILSSCDRRELTYPQEGIPFLITPDWSALAPGEEPPQYLKALFFPVGGGPAVERYIAPDGEEVLVPPGEYRVIVYNWRTNAETQTVQFRGDSYETFEAYIVPRAATLRKRNEQDLHLIAQPDAQLYSWNADGGSIVISPTTPVVRTRATRGNTLTATMQPMVRQYVMEINVKNAQYINSISALLTDAYGTRPLGGGGHDGSRYAVETTIRPGDTRDGVTTYYCYVTTFGLYDDTDKKLVVSISDQGDDQRLVEADATDLIDKVDNGELPPGEVLVIIPRDEPIEVEVPDESGEGGGFAPPALDDWIENDKEITM